MINEYGEKDIQKFGYINERHNLLLSLISFYIVEINRDTHQRVPVYFIHGYEYVVFPCP